MGGRVGALSVACTETCQMGTAGMESEIQVLQKKLAAMRPALHPTSIVEASDGLFELPPMAGGRVMRGRRIVIVVGHNCGGRSNCDADRNQGAGRQAGSGRQACQRTGRSWSGRSGCCRCRGCRCWRSFGGLCECLGRDQAQGSAQSKKLFHVFVLIYGNQNLTSAIIASQLYQLKVDLLGKKKPSLFPAHNKQHS